MSKKLLVTSALSSTWSNKEFMIFLGDWCKKDNNFSSLDKEKYQIFKYHWDDRSKLKKDYEYLKTLEKKVLLELIKFLNGYHNKNFSERYWKILLGPWLITLLQIIFERYSNLKFFFEENKGEEIETIILNKQKKQNFISNNFEEFSRYTLTDTWNYFLYVDLINFEKFEFPVKKTFLTYVDEENYKAYLNLNYSKKNKFFSFFSYMVEKIIGSQDILISESYLGKFQELSLSLKLKSIPRYSQGVKSFGTDIDHISRTKHLGLIADNVFEEFIKSNIIKFIPKSFMEDFDFVSNYINKMHWPKKPKVIFTSHFMQKTFQSRYVAECIEKNDTKLIIGQHGGVYGQYLFSSMEDYELNICDKYLSWGWNNSKNKKIIPFGIIKNIKELEYNRKNEDLLMIFRSQTKYTHRINSYSGTNQIKKYFYENIEFCKKLDKEIVENNLILRFHARKFGWNEDEIFKKTLGKIRLDLGYSKIFDLITKSKLVLQTYIGTGYLETLTCNIPTVIFANTNECLLDEQTLKDLEELRKKNIFFDDRDEAAKFINQVWKDVPSWWFDKSTQEARENFCFKYSKIIANKDNQIIEIINNLK